VSQGRGATLGCIRQYHTDALLIEPSDFVRFSDPACQHCDQFPSGERIPSKDFTKDYDRYLMFVSVAACALSLQNPVKFRPGKNPT
jgi:hypothetical protein